MDKKERFERYKYLTGLSSWEIASYLDKDNVIFVNDGPSGLRKPLNQDFAKQEEIIQTVCFPTPSSLASSFDQDIVYLNGTLLAKECLYHKTNILLAPAINIKDYVLCGRNFEYFSEDPYLGGVLAASYINGLEDNNVGACVKHYALNSQEFARTINNSIVSYRALNEIYLGVFKYVFKYSNPTSLMTSYNKVNDEYVNESDYLINTKLRKEYNFKGFIVSDWCAVSNKWLGIKTGVNVEMPLSRMSNEFIDRGYNKYFNDQDLINRDRELFESISKFKNTKKLEYLDLDELHEKATQIASKTIVLAKNDNDYLPFKKDDNVLVIGYFANHNYFVGGGSGYVRAYKPLTFLDVLNKEKINYEFIEGYNPNEIIIDEDKLKEYKDKFNKVLIFFGQYEKDEEEGKDRNSLDLDAKQLEVLSLVKNYFDEVASIVISGSVVNVEKIYKESSALLITYLAGEGQNEAIYNNVYGLVNPSARLSETWISSIYQNPIIKEYLRRDIYNTYHHDDIYVGYRYYNLNKKGFMLPFGYGLSYSKFNYSNITHKIIEDNIVINLDIENISSLDGEEVIQVYVSKKMSNIYRPIRELKAFKKEMILAKEKKNIDIKLEIDNLKSYRDKTDAFELEDGEYEIYIAKNSEEIIDEFRINLDGIVFEEIKEPIKLQERKIPNIYNFDSPAGLLFDNKIFKQYVVDNNLNIDINEFENRKWYLDTRTFRGLINDNEWDISFEEMEKLIEYLNKYDLKDKRKINFDEYVIKHQKLLKW